MKTIKSTALIITSLVLVCTGCWEKEVTKSIENTERVDALRRELFELQRLVFGSSDGETGLATINEMLQLENKEVEEQIAIIQNEIDRLTEEYNKGIPYQVIVTNFQGLLIEGAYVTINENGTIVSGITNAEGKVTFGKVRAGAVVGVVSAPGFATANYGTSLYLGHAGVNTHVALLPKSGALAESSMFTLQGYLYADLNTANDTLTGFYFGDEVNTMFAGSTAANRLPEGPNAKVPHRSFDEQNKKLSVTIDMHKSYIPYSNYYNSNPGSIQFIAYEGVTWEATFDENNQYTVQLPVSSYFETNIINFSFKFSIEEFVATKTMVDSGASSVWSDDYQYDSYSGSYLSEIPTSAYPAPKTFTQTRVFRVGGYQYNNSFNGLTGSEDEINMSTDDFGPSGMGAMVGQTYNLDFYYYDFRN